MDNVDFMVRRISHIITKSSIILSCRFWPFVPTKKVVFVVSGFLKATDN